MQGQPIICRLETSAASWACRRPSTINQAYIQTPANLNLGQNVWVARSLPAGGCRGCEPKRPLLDCRPIFNVIPVRFFLC